MGQSPERNHCFWQVFHSDGFKSVMADGAHPTSLPMFVSLAASNNIHPDQDFAESEILETSHSCKYSCSEKRKNVSKNHLKICG